MFLQFFFFTNKNHHLHSIKQVALFCFWTRFLQLPIQWRIINISEQLLVNEYFLLEPKTVLSKVGKFA